MFERRLTEDDVRAVLATGETVERYPNDVPYPSRLVLAWRGGRPIHVVVADNREESELVVVTVYEPDPRLWQPGFRRRKP